MTTAKWTINRGEQQDLEHYPPARFTEKGCVPVWGGDALTSNPTSAEYATLHSKMR
jgi:hypothetical protein